MKTLTIIATLVCTQLTLLAQEPPKIKYGKISTADLQQKVYSMDSNASAVILSDIGSTKVEGNSKGWFSLVHKRHKRVHILNKSAYNLADVNVYLYHSGDNEEKLDALKATTYNLDNGVVVETKLNKSDVFKDKYDKNRLIKKFTLPNVKEGSIIEYEYVIISDYLFNFQPWSFQTSHPQLWSEYTVSIPQFLNYVFISQGSQKFDLNKKKDYASVFNVRDQNGAGTTQNYAVNSGVTDYRWGMKNVAALKEESYTSTIDNHMSRIEFQLAAYQHPLQPKQIMSSWQKLAEDMLKDEEFGAALDKSNNWMDDVVKPVITGAATDLQKAKAVYAFVRDQFTCTNHNGVWMKHPLKELLRSKSGTVAEVNILLTAMLRHINIEADPVILSTTEHGYTYPLYPLLNRFNYVVTKVRIDGADYYLDASRPRLGFGKLTPDCYNGTARIINAAATAVDLIADSLKEKKVTAIYIHNTDKGKWEGSMQQVSGYYESYHIRDKIKEKGEQTFFKDVEKAFGLDISIKKPEIDSLNRYDDPLKMKYIFDVNLNNEDILYINPMLGEGYKKNPFEAAERHYPVEMPFTIDETYVLNMQVPEGYQVEELPKQIAVKMNEDGDGYFEYLITQSGNIVSLRSRIKLNRAYYAAEEYEYMREFFKMIVNKHNEQIVFKKKK